MLSHAFDEWWEHYGAPYEAAVLEAGSVPWPLDEAKLSALGLDGMEPMQARRALWDRRYQRPAPLAVLRA